MKVEITAEITNRPNHSPPQGVDWPYACRNLVRASGDHRGVLVAVGHDRGSCSFASPTWLPVMPSPRCGCCR
jgi:hypothetical protein